MRVAAVTALALAGLLQGSPGPASKPGFGPLPGDPLGKFQAARKGLVATGGLVVPGSKPGFKFEIWEDHLGKEHKFGKTFLPCDPSDTSGVVYVPKATLLVQRSPDGQRLVVADKRALLVKSDAEVDKHLAAEEAFIAAHQAPPRSWRDRLARWWRKNVTKEPHLPFIFDDGRMTISKGEAVLPGSGEVVELVLAPFFEGADLTGEGADGESGESAEESDEPTPRPTPIATDSLRGPLKIIRYLKPYERLALEDLAPYVKAKQPRPRKRPLY